MIPYSKQHINKDEIEAIIEVLKSDFLTTGPKVEEFESIVAEYCGARYSIAVSNGTAALHVAAMAIGLQAGDEGITSPNTFLASPNCLAFCNSVPQFADINSDTYCIDPNEIRKAVSSKTRVIVPVHFAGQPCDMESIWELAKQKGFYVIEDAAHAIGSSWKDQKGIWHKVGLCSHSHLTVFSFHPVKTITTGEGGMILTNDEALAQNCRLLRNHGIERDPNKFLYSSSSMPLPLSSNYPPWYYEMHQLGYNYRITDLQCAIGLTQMQRLDQFVAKRRKIWKFYNSKLAGIKGFKVPVESNGVRSAWHLYVAQATQRDELIAFLHKNGIGAHAMYFPIHLQPYYQKHFGYRKGDFPKAEAYFKKCLILPLFPTLQDTELKYIVDKVQSFYHVR